MYLPNLSTTGKMRHKVNFFKQSKTGLNSDFSFFQTGCLTKAIELSLFNYLPIAEERKDGFIPFSEALT